MDKHKQSNGHPAAEDDELSDEKWAEFEKEVNKYCGDHWINRKTNPTNREEAPASGVNITNSKSKLGDTWDFPMSVMNSAYQFKSVAIQDKDFQRQLNAGDPFEICAHHQVQDSTCACGYVEKIKKCSKCQKMFCGKCHPDPSASTSSQDHQKQKAHQKGGKPKSTNSSTNHQKVGADFPPCGAFPGHGYVEPSGESFNNSHGVYPVAPVLRIPRDRDPYTAQNQMGQLGYFPSLNPMVFQGQMPQMSQPVNAGPNTKEVPFKHPAPPISPIIPIIPAPPMPATNQKSWNPRNPSNNNPKMKDSPQFQNKAQNFPTQFGPWSIIQNKNTGSNTQRNDAGGVHQSKHVYYQKPNQDRSSEEMARKPFVAENTVKEHFSGHNLHYSQRNSVTSPTTQWKIDDILNRGQNKGQDNQQNMQHNAGNYAIGQGIAGMNLSGVTSDNKRSRDISIAESAVSYNTAPVSSSDNNEKSVFYNTTAVNSIETLINPASKGSPPGQKENTMKVDADILSLLQGASDSLERKIHAAKMAKTERNFKDDVLPSENSREDEGKKEHESSNKKRDNESCKDIDLEEPLTNPFKTMTQVKTVTEDKKTAQTIIPQIPLKYGIGNRQFSLKKPVVERQKFPTLGDLKLGLDIAALKNRKEGVFVTHFYSFDKVHIITADSFHHDFTLLKEDIFEAISDREGGKPFDYPPEVGTVLLAPLNGQYNRAVVEEICFEAFVVVRFIDIGSTTRLRLGSVYQIPKEILDVPILGAEVYLKDITDRETDMILLSDFNKLVNNWPANRICFVKSVDKVNGKDCVKLDFSLNGVANSLSDQIIGLGKWEWQRRWESTPGITEAGLCNESHWHVNCFEKQLRRLEVGVKTKGRVATRTSESAEIAFLLNVEGEYYYRDKQVFQRQLDKYVDVVIESSKFFPALDEYLLVKIEPNEDEDLRNLRGVGKWSRCVRSDSILINLDECECYPVSIDYRNIVTIRKYCPDFSRVPFFMTNCRVKDCLPLDDKTRAIFNDLAQPGKVLTFCALDSDGFNVTCDEFYERLAE